MAQKVEQKDQKHQQSTMDKVKEQFHLISEKVKDQVGAGSAAKLPLHRLLKRANHKLSKFLKYDQSMDSNKLIPMELLLHCRGILFLSCDTDKNVMNKEDGTGFIMAHLSDHKERKWSGPCSVGLLHGLNIGGEHTDFFVVFHTDKALNMFMAKGHIKFGADLSIKEGPMGKDMKHCGKFDAFSYGIWNDKELKGVSLDGEGITVKPQCNEKCYGSKIGRKELLETYPDNMFNEDYNKLIELLNNVGIHDPNIKDKEFGNKEAPKIDKVIDDQEKDLNDDTIKQKEHVQDELLDKTNKLNMNDQDKFGKDIHVKDFEKDVCDKNKHHQ
jgi:lipid-binding SYLF domain-containing protein